LKNKKNRFPPPSSHDLEVWNNVSSDLIDWLYSGLTGKFQIKGHQIIGSWSKVFTNKIVLEVGCGHGHHLKFSNQAYQSYFGLDIEIKFLETLLNRYPENSVINGDAYGLPFKNHSVDCVLSIYNFEHLRELDKALEEISRVLKPDGMLLLSIPAEGGFLYGVGRSLTSKPYMERKYGIDYDAIVHYEHCNNYKDIVNNLKRKFNIIEKSFIPFCIPSFQLNAIICIRAKPICFC
jgi:ubiquinone/menaquinone biosynthesis C-methylase UbiE